MVLPVLVLRREVFFYAAALRLTSHNTSLLPASLFPSQVLLKVFESLANSLLDISLVPLVIGEQLLFR